MHVTYNKCLGVLLDEKLTLGTFKTHIEYTYIFCNNIASLCKLVTLYNSHVQPFFDYCSPLLDTCGQQLKDKLQKLQNGAGRVINGSSYDIRSVEFVLDNVKWKNLATRRTHIEATIMYKILTGQCAPHLRDSFTKLNDHNINYNLGNLETDLSLPRPKTNFAQT